MSRFLRDFLIVVVVALAVFLWLVETLVGYATE